MIMFDNIVFDEFTLLEGKQADEYRKRKESQARAEKIDILQMHNLELQEPLEMKLISLLDPELVR